MVTLGIHNSKCSSGLHCFYQHHVYILDNCMWQHCIDVFGCDNTPPRQFSMIFTMQCAPSLGVYLMSFIRCRLCRQPLRPGRLEAWRLRFLSIVIHLRRFLTFVLIFVDFHTRSSISIDFQKMSYYCIRFRWFQGLGVSAMRRPVATCGSRLWAPKRRICAWLVGCMAGWLHVWLAAWLTGGS